MTFEASSHLKDFLKKLLIKNPENRLSIDLIKKQPWITNQGTDPMPALEYLEIEPSESDLKNALG